MPYTARRRLLSFLARLLCVSLKEDVKRGHVVLCAQHDMEVTALVYVDTVNPVGETVIRLLKDDSVDIDLCKVNIRADYLGEKLRAAVPINTDFTLVIESRKVR